MKKQKRPSRGRDATSSQLRRAIKEFDFERFLIAEGLDVEPRGSELVAECPFCPEGKRESFYVEAERGMWICHRCLRKGGPVRLVADIAEISYNDAVQRILKNFAVFVDEDDEEEEEFEEAKVDSIELPEEFRPLAGNTSLSSKPYKRYARRRNIGRGLWQPYNIGYCATGRYAGRLIVPVTHLGRYVTFVARAISDNAERKVDTPPGNSQASYLFNLDNLWGSSRVVITEGVFDALAIPELAVASFGKKVSLQQAHLLRQAGVKTVVFCFDEDARDEAEDFANMYGGYFKTEFVELPEGEDPSSLGAEATRELIEKAKKIRLW